MKNFPDDYNEEMQKFAKEITEAINKINASVKGIPKNIFSKELREAFSKFPSELRFALAILAKHNWYINLNMDLRKLLMRATMHRTKLKITLGPRCRLSHYLCLCFCL